MVTRWALAAVLLGRGAEAAEWRVELLGGMAASFGSPLTVRQAGEPDLEIAADWAGRSLDSPIYYAARLGRWTQSTGLSLQLVHHKLYLQNPPPEIQAFSVSHGYNLLTLEGGWLAGGFELRAGAGLVIAHPESTVRGQAREETGGLFGGYHATGPTLAIAAGRWLDLGGRFRVGAEARFTASWARVPVAGGEASVPDRSVHLLVGVAYRFAPPQ
ncbi:MAG TPA: hypothetical protein VIC87_11210 [Vicinamibacteria bacterium]|jgi:hypothetical protein